MVLETHYGPVIVNRHDTVIGHWIARDGGWEKDEIELLRWVVTSCYPQENEVEILDIGANIGSHTIAFARFPFRNLVVHAFEAQRIIFQMLAGTVALNSLDNVYCHHKAVSSEADATIEIPALDYDAPGDFGSLELEPVSGSDFVARRLSRPAERVNTVRIDDLNLQRVRLIKVDAEGMEHKVFAGAVNTIDRGRPVLFFE
jgi:FkbM family methyltransferase